MIYKISTQKAALTGVPLFGVTTFCISTEILALSVNPALTLSCLDAHNLEETSRSLAKPSRRELRRCLTLFYGFPVKKGETRQGDSRQLCIFLEMCIHGSPQGAVRYGRGSPAHISATRQRDFESEVIHTTIQQRLIFNPRIDPGID